MDNPPKYAIGDFVSIPKYRQEGSIIEISTWFNEFPDEKECGDCYLYRIWSTQWYPEEYLRKRKKK